MDQGQIALQLMALYGKLRRATDEQVKQALKQQIDALVASLRPEPLRAEQRPQPSRGQMGAAAGDD